ncbi:MAG: hypothetical protein U0I48_00475 [Acutalibacteraceae bacterium]|nr:hypothetical protein [Acutalibacteraceae bacterium]
MKKGELGFKKHGNLHYRVAVRLQDNEKPLLFQENSIGQSKGVKNKHNAVKAGTACFAMPASECFYRI